MAFRVVTPVKEVPLAVRAFAPVVVYVVPVAEPATVPAAVTFSMPVAAMPLAVTVAPLIV